MFGAPPYYIPAFETYYSADFSTGSCSYSLSTIWICQWKEGHSYVFSRWISSYIFPIPCDIYHSGNHCTHQSHSSGPFDNPLQYNSAWIDAPQSPLVHVSLDWHSSISFCCQFLHCQLSSVGICTFQSPVASLVVLYFIPHFLPQLVLVPILQCRHYLISIGTPLQWVDIVQLYCRLCSPLLLPIL